MSTSEIISELPRLKADELARLQLELEEELRHRRRAANLELIGIDFLLDVAGTAEGLPPDLAENHDHYLYGTPSRNRK